MLGIFSIQGQNITNVGNLFNKGFEYRQCKTHFSLVFMKYNQPARQPSSKFCFCCKTSFDLLFHPSLHPSMLALECQASNFDELLLYIGAMLKCGKDVVQVLFIKGLFGSPLLSNSQHMGMISSTVIPLRKGDKLITKTRQFH